MADNLKIRDLDTLSRAAELRERFDAGIFPRTVGDRSHFKRLERLGLIIFDASGVDMDREQIGNEVAIYRLTEAGTKALADYDWTEERAAETRRKAARRGK